MSVPTLSASHHNDSQTPVVCQFLESPAEGYGPEGYGPEFIAVETEVVAAESETCLLDGDNMLVNTTDCGQEFHSGPIEVVPLTDNIPPVGTCDVMLSSDNVVMGSSQHVVGDSYCMTNEAVGTRTKKHVFGTDNHLPLDSETVKTQVAMDHIVTCQVAVGNWTGHHDRLMEPHPNIVVPCQLPATNVMTQSVRRDNNINVLDIKSMTDAGLKNELKKLQDREKKREKRGDPVYREKEREQALVRMRNRRKDPFYRDNERLRDRARRQLSRSTNSELRNQEKERDKMYKRLRRLKVLQLPLGSLMGDVQSNFSESTSCNTHSSELEEHTVLQFSETDPGVLDVNDVYKHMEVKTNDCSNMSNTEL